MANGRKGWRIVSESGTVIATCYDDHAPEGTMPREYAREQADFWANHYQCKVTLEPITLERDNRY